MRRSLAATVLGIAAVLGAQQQSVTAEQPSTVKDAALKDTMSRFYAAISVAKQVKPLREAGMTYYEPGAATPCAFLAEPALFTREHIDDAMHRKNAGTYFIVADSYLSQSVDVVSEYAVDIESEEIALRPMKAPSAPTTQYRLRSVVVWHRQSNGTWLVTFQEFTSDP